MFKKRTANNKTSQTANHSINLLDQIGNISTHDLTQQNPPSPFNQTPQKIDPSAYQNNQIPEKPQTQQGHSQFLQKLQRDQKLQALFHSFENQQNTLPPQHQIKNHPNHYNHEESAKPYLKVKNPIKFVLPAQKKINLYSATHQNQQTKKILTTIHASQTRNIQQKLAKDKEMEDLFKQIIQKQQKEEEQATQINPTQSHQSSTLKASVKPNQFIIEDDDGYVEEMPQSQFVYKHSDTEQASMLKVEIDYEGNISPQLSDNDNEDVLEDNFHEEDFEDELIRKTLTRHNYLKLQQNSNLKQSKISQKKDKLLNSILKTSWYEIEARISADINSKVAKRNELEQEMRYLEERISQRSNEMDRKKVALKQLQNEQKRIKKVIYFICYFGDQLISPGQAIESFFEDLTGNIISKIQKLAERVGIEEFMQKKRSREELRDKYRSGRKKIKTDEAQEQNGQIAEEQEDEDDDDGECYMQDDDY